MLKLKACPRCEGDLHINRDMYGPYRQCLQCGYMGDLPCLELGCRCYAPDPAGQFFDLSHISGAFCQFMSDALTFCHSYETLGVPAVPDGRPR